MGIAYEYHFSDGVVLPSTLDALLWLKNNQHLTVVRKMNGLEEEVTSKLLAILNDHQYGEAR